MKQKVLLFLILSFLLISPFVKGQAPTLPAGVVLPDNIVDVDCYIDPPSAPFSFSLLASSPTGIFNETMPLVGDIDNDGIIEIIAIGPGHAANRIHIFEFKNNNFVLQQSVSTPIFAGIANPLAIAKVDDNEYAAIFLCTSHTSNSTADRGRLIKYIYNSNTGLYEEFKVNGNLKRGTYSAISSKEMAQPMIVDFNGDGIPEIVAYDKVFNAQTMELLVDGNLLQYANTASPNDMGFGYGGHTSILQQSEASSIMAIGDMDNDGIPEVIAGNCVYKINITNPNGISGNTFTLWSKCDKTDESGGIHNEAVDGATSIADIDGDGYLDVIVTVRSDRNPINNNGAIYIWNPRTKKVMHKNQLTNIPPHNTYRGPSVAFVGDIDGDGYPEICFTGQRIMYAMVYDRIAKTISIKWSRSTNDSSASTTMSLFDFNQDKKHELIYRDESHLRIINGADGSDLIPPVSCTSGTANEYPVIADINGDGSAEIIVTGGSQVHVYSSNPAGLWAPARTVWNQFAYNAVNINEDLTVPSVQFNPATRFAGSNEILGDGDDVYPFNGYLMQQTALNQYGKPLWITPRAEIIGTPTFNYDNSSGGKITITLQVKNIGSYRFQNPFYVSIFKDAIGGFPNETIKYENTIDIGKTITLTLVLENFDTIWTPNNFLIIKINAKADGATDQEVCGEDNTLFFYYGLQPMQQEACKDNIVEVESTFTHYSYYTYQWQYSTNEATWTDISGATTSTYTPAYQEPGIGYYRIKITDSNDPGNIVYHYTASVKVISRRCIMPVNPNIHILQ